MEEQVPRLEKPLAPKDVEAAAKAAGWDCKPQLPIR